MARKESKKIGKNGKKRTATAEVERKVGATATATVHVEKGAPAKRLTMLRIFTKYVPKSKAVVEYYCVELPCFYHLPRVSAFSLFFTIFFHLLFIFVFSVQSTMDSSLGRVTDGLLQASLALGYQKPSEDNPFQWDTLPLPYPSLAPGSGLGSGSGLSEPKAAENLLFDPIAAFSPLIPTIFTPSALVSDMMQVQARTFARSRITAAEDERKDMLDEVALLPLEDPSSYTLLDQILDVRFGTGFEEIPGVTTLSAHGGSTSTLASRIDSSVALAVEDVLLESGNANLNALSTTVHSQQNILQQYALLPPAYPSEGGDDGAEMGQREGGEEDQDLKSLQIALASLNSLTQAIIHQAESFRLGSNTQ